MAPSAAPQQEANGSAKKDNFLNATSADYYFDSYSHFGAV